MSDTQALATRELTIGQIKQRIELNQKSGWGLEKASGPQLNWLALFCQRNNLMPGIEATLYEGKPWITVDGHVTLMRRQPEYRGYSQRPLSPREKEEWGYDPDDIVVETSIRTATLGEIKAHGRVSEAERSGTYVQGVRHNPVAKHHAVAMAQKRSLARAQRLTFGMESYVDEEDFERDVQTVIAERNDPERVQRDANRYAEVFGEDESDSPYNLPADQPAAERASVAAEDDASTVDAQVDASVPAELLERNAQLAQDAASVGVKRIGHLRADASWTATQVERANEQLAAKIQEEQAKQAVF